jgi:hypothetical protein
MPSAATVRADTVSQNIAQGGGAPTTTLLSGGQGDNTLKNGLKKTLLGQ